MNNGILNKAKTLVDHGIKVDMRANSIFALSESCKNGITYGTWVNVTDMNIMEWLGY